MLKHSELIESLTDEQKIRILCGVGNISEKDIKNLGVPSVKIGNMKDYGRKIYPHTTSLSHAWNTSLWSRVASAKAGMMLEDKIGFAISPGAKIKLSPYRKETTEDPYLASMISAAYMKAVKEANISVGASGYYVTETDADWMDRHPDNRILHEYIVRPYEEAARIASVKNLVTDIRLDGTPYEGVCEHIWREIKEQAEFFICEHATDSNTVRLISNGVVCLSASGNALSTALMRYRSLVKAAEDGSNDAVRQIEEECASGEAISIESIDAAVDRTLDFLFQCSENTEGTVFEEDEDELARKATLESTVLLKNKNALLPLHPRTQIKIVDAFSPQKSGTEAISSDLAKRLKDAGYQKVNVRSTDDNDEKKMLLPGYKADVAILLLGAGYEAERIMHKTEKLSLPPSQLELIERVSKTAKRFVAVIFSEHAPDIEFATGFDGVILAPLPVKHSAEALAEIISGEYCPSGRLAYTLYSGTDVSLRKGMAYVKNYGMKAGPFIGYRYYDTAEMCVGYPFGHGLSYTEFDYSDISVNGREVSFTVRNSGKVKGTEVAQVYVGMNESATVRPKKELCAFARVELCPGESKRLALEIDIPKVYHEGAFVSERGTYTVYVGASVSDIRLTETYVAGDTEIKKEEVRLSDYLQSYSNILNDKFTLEADYSTMKKGIKNIVTGASALTLAIVLAIFNTTTYTQSLFLGVISGILAVAAILFLVIEIVERNRFYEEERKKIAEANDQHFENAEQIPVAAVDTMFKQQFDLADIETFENNEISENKDSFDVSAYIDDQFFVRDAVGEFYSFASERGYKISSGIAESLISSMMVSRLLIFTGLSSEEFNSFSRLLAEYFGCALCIDDSEQGDAENGNTVYDGYDSEGNNTEKNILRALENAVNQPTKIHISAVNGISLENVNEWTSPIMKYASSRKSKNEIVISTEGGRKHRYVLGSNFWVILRLSDNQALESLPMPVLKCAAVVPIFFSRHVVSEDVEESQGFTSYQVEFMLDHENGKHDISEDIWKKVDKIEKYAKQHSEYTIGNKLWLELEKQVCMLLACEMDATDAIDAALAVRVLPSLSAVLNRVLDKDEKTVLQVVESVLGTDHVQYSKAYVDSLTVKEKAKVSNVIDTETDKKDLDGKDELDDDEDFDEEDFDDEDELEDDEGFDDEDELEDDEDFDKDELGDEKDDTTFSGGENVHSVDGDE